VGLRPLVAWDSRFESRPVHGCLSVVSVVCCQVQFSATGRSLVQRSPTDCGVTECDLKTSIMRKPWTTRVCFATEIIIIFLSISFMQGIYTYNPETNHIPRVHRFAAVLVLLFMVLILLVNIIIIIIIIIIIFTIINVIIPSVITIILYLNYCLFILFNTSCFICLKMHPAD
jgi:hypothetical protein